MSVSLIFNGTFSSNLNLTTKGQLNTYSTSAILLSASTTASAKLYMATNTSVGWANQSTSGQESLQGVTSVSASAATSGFPTGEIAYLNNIPQTFKHLILRIYKANPNPGPSYQQILIYNASSQTVGGVYTHWYLNPNTTTASYGTGSMISSNFRTSYSTSVSGLHAYRDCVVHQYYGITSGLGFWEMFISNYTSTGYKLCLTKATGKQGSTTYPNVFVSTEGYGVMESSSAVTHIGVQAGAAWQGGYLSLWGIRE